MTNRSENKNIEQLPFDFPLLNSQSFDDFAISESNKGAVRHINMWPSWEQHSLLIIGPNSCGKTHLVQSFKNITGGELLEPENLPEIDDFLTKLDKKSPIVIIDDADKTVDETALFHIFNAVKEVDGWLLLTAKNPPQQWQLSLSDLSSRLMAMPQVKIDLPDENLLRAVLIKQFSDRQLLVNDAVINYLTTRMERSFQGVMKLVDLIDKAALKDNKNITIPLARDVIKTYEDQYN
jgi:DnaA regulatory inactivator Hda